MSATSVTQNNYNHHSKSDIKVSGDHSKSQAKVCTFDCSSSSDLLIPPPPKFHKFHETLQKLAYRLAECFCRPDSPCGPCRDIHSLIRRAENVVATVPASRLVGIELNPGPNPVTTVVLRVPSKPKTPKKKKIPKRKRNRNSKVPRLLSGDLFTQYVSSLNDPFNYPPPKLGFGCMVPTNIFTAYLRGQYTASTDGSFAIFCAPTVGSSLSPIYYSNGLSTAVAWNPVTFPNAAIIGNSAGEGRVISSGIRVLPLQAATAAPGIIYSGAIPSASNSALVGYTSTLLAASPCLEFGDSRDGAVSVSRPSDLSAYIFTQSSLIGNATGLWGQSTPVIVCLGLVPSSTVMVEVVVNVETIISVTNSQGNLVGANPGGAPNVEPTVSDSFPSLDSLWSATKHHLTNAANFGTFLSSTKVGDTSLGGYAVKGAMSYFNSHRAGHRAMSNINPQMRLME
jgi:hypothetical protein